MYDFITLDVETANHQYHSICQIGLAFVEKNRVTKTWGVYINPETTVFSNTEIHGITFETVKKAMTFPQVIKYIEPHIKGSLLVHHTAFDRIAMGQAAERYQIDLSNFFFCDSAQYAQGIDMAFSTRGFGLIPLCQKFGVETQGHHDAVNDAIMLARLVISLQNHYKMKIKDGEVRTAGDEPMRSAKTKPDAWTHINQDAIREGPLTGLEFVLTGDFESSKQELSDLIVNQGGNVRDKVTFTTSHLVVGKPSHFQKGELSIKHQKALELKRQGSHIKIIDEDNIFEILVDQT